MNDYEIEEHIAFIMRKSRDDAGISRDTMAKRLNVSTKTIQNYEDGSSCPSIKTLIKWFQIIDVPLYPYILQINSNYLMEINANSTDEEVRQAMIKTVQKMDIKQMRQHFFEMVGDTGTAPDGMGEVKTAYLHLPMHTKVGIAEIICTQYEIYKARGELVQPDKITPDIDKLKGYIAKAKEAVINGKSTYL